MTDSGLIVLTSFISPFRAERRLARELAMAGEFIEIYVDTPFEVASRRDPKGLYKRARSPERSRISPASIQPYERPEAADIVLCRLREYPLAILAPV
jgi:bifunctional enzyme CysN/CysC